MDTKVDSPIKVTNMSDRDFSRLGEFIHDSCGIKITPAKMDLPLVPVAPTVYRKNR